MAGIQDLAQYGRGNDSMMAHVTPGEMMVPPEMMARHPDLQKKLYQAYIEEGFDPRQFKVGSGITSLNPVTGKPEYGFFKKLFKLAAPVIGYALGGPMGAAIGGGLAGATSGGGIKGALKGAALGYVGGSLASGGAFGETVAGWSGGGIGGIGSFGNIGGSAGSWGSDAVSRTVANKGVGGAWKHLAKKVANSPMAMSALLNSVATEPDAVGSSYVPNTDKGEGFKIDYTDSGATTDPGTGKHKVTSDTTGYGAYANYDAPTLPVNVADYVASPLITPTPMVIGNPNLTEEELMEYYKPVTYSHGGMIKHGTTGTADDVPIMASKGEFVMTADAVRNAGQGDPRLGAKKLYDLMYTLEGAR
jgi:hypothetical protein